MKGEESSIEESGLDPVFFRGLARTLPSQGCWILDVAIQGPSRGYPKTSRVSVSGAPDSLAAIPPSIGIGSVKKFPCCSGQLPN